jgi:WD40 repeat protein
MINLSGGATTANTPQKTTPIPTSSYRPPSEISNNSKQQTFKLDLSEPQDKLELFKYLECKSKGTKYVQAKFSNLNKCLLVSREDGYLELINFNNNKLITECKFHDDVIMDFDIDSKNGIILTASIDGYACVINIDTFQVINRFHPLNPTRNLNTCKIMNVKNPNYEKTNTKKSSEMFTESNMQNYVCNLFNPNPTQKSNEMVQLDIDSLFVSNAPSENKKTVKVNKKDKELSFSLMSGGQDSKLVTTTNVKEGGFDTLTYNSMTGEQISIFQDHFGPINTLAVNEHARIIASGAEDATIRIYKLENFVLNHLIPEKK